MCFYHSNWSDPKIAQRDLVCYKIFYEDGKLRSLYRSCTYTLNYLYKAKLGQKQKVDYTRVINLLDKEIRGSLFCIHEGLHSFQRNYKKVRDICEEENLSCYSFPTNIYKCIIPKGSEYYKNQGGEYVSNQLIVKEKVF